MRKIIYSVLAIVGLIMTVSQGETAAANLIGLGMLYMIGERLKVFEP